MFIELIKGRKKDLKRPTFLESFAAIWSTILPPVAS